MANLRLRRVKTIMKTADGADFVSRDAIWIAARAAEFFVQDLAQKAYRAANNPQTLEYHHLTEIIHNCDEYDFLQLMIPKKVTVEEYRRRLARKQRRKEQMQQAGTSGMSSRPRSSNKSKK